MRISSRFSQSIKYVALATAMFAAIGSQAVTIPNTPLIAQVPTKPMVMLVAGRDHKLFYEAYNDTSDIDGDGSLDIGFIPNNPNIIYYGLFDPTLCYKHNDKNDNTGLFTPVSKTATGKCPGQWSGLWLNYMTTSRIDAIRKVLYGGHRDVDTASSTILRRAYIPQDAHSWGKEYTSEAVNGYKISDYTPFAQPTAGTRHFFGNLTANQGVHCSTLTSCSTMPPLLRVRQNVGDDRRIWEWASKERPVLAGKLSKKNGATGEDDFPSGTSSAKNYTIRVSVCDAGFINGCKKYPDGSYKPVGLLHDYGENDALLFGLLTGSYDQHMSGGRLRKVVSSFTDEVDPKTGQFTAGAAIVNTFNNLRIRGFNQGSNSNEYLKSGPYDDSVLAPTEGQFVDWGNPIGEMMYEATRYFAGKMTPTEAFTTGTTHDTAVQMKSAGWDDPYSKDSAAKASRCTRASFLTISDISPSFDSDQLPGSAFNTTYSSDLTGLNVSTEGNTITKVESTITGKRFIGESDGVSDSAPTVKDVTSLSTIRGLAPGEPAKQGSYYSASVASFAKRTDLRSDLDGTQSIDTFVVGLTSPLPEIKVPFEISKGKYVYVTLVPFSKTINYGSKVESAKTKYQPTNQIVDFYVETIANSGPKDANPDINEGRYYAKFIINYEDVEQGGDHDMDAIAEYVVKKTADDKMSVTVTPTYQQGSMRQNMGYVISGTQADGTYLVAQDETYSNAYFLNVPAGQKPGYCDVATPPEACKQLPTIGDTPATFEFTPSGSNASLLEGPLWYAAKWGGFKDANNNNQPDLKSEWDADNNGVPDNYFLVQNPSKLSQTLQKAFDNIAKTNSSSSNVTTNSANTSSTNRVFQARFENTYWSGDLVAYPVTDLGVSLTPDWRAGSKLLNDTDRKLFMRTSAAETKEFLWDNLPDAEKTSLVSEDAVNYLRGKRDKEVQSGGAYRNRSTTVLGDLVHSSPFYVKEINALFVGGNDGMLHAFKASDDGLAGTAGSELFGFIPSDSLSRLHKLTSPSYEHDYYVDGDIVVTPRTAETGNHNYLFAALGRGGKGLFGLDVTSPSTFAASNFLWEYTPAADTDAADDEDLGQMLGRPIYAKMKNGKGAIIVGNGYNSTNGKAVLYIFILNADGTLDAIKKLDTGVGGDNGLSSPTEFDENNDGLIDVIYAGDLKGNVWKFDVSGADSGSWNVAYNKPLFVAKDAKDVVQPITAPLTVVKNPIESDPNFGKVFVFFGTGSYFRTTDPTDTSTQTWYGVIDDGVAITNRSNMTERKVSQTGTFGGKSVRTFSVAKTGDMKDKAGWYLDFIDPTEPVVATGERIVTQSLLQKLIVPALIASSIIPNHTNSCIPGGKGYINALDPFSGGAITKGIFDVNNEKGFADDLLDEQYIGSVDPSVELTGLSLLNGDKLVFGGTDKDNPVGSLKANLGTTPLKGRIGWREIIKD